MEGVVVGRGREPRPTALAGGACPACWPADAEAACGEGTPNGGGQGPAGRRGGGVGLLGSTPGGRGEDPRNT